MEFLEIIKSFQVQKILAYFFTNPEKKHYVRELAALLDEDAGNLSRALKKLEDEKIFLVSYIGKQKFFSLNKNHPLFAELKSLVEKTIGVAGALEKEIPKIRGISQGFIYGSWAKRQPSLGSDIDLFLVGKFDEEKLLKVIAKLEKRLGREINYVFFAPKEFRRAKKLNSFVQGVMKSPKIMIVGKENEL